ncbi:hypothetical protein ES703_109811 [subsurface metagenome]
MIQAIDPSAIPIPNKNGELIVTLIGAGPAIETYGLCLFYNESAHELKRLTINLIEKVHEWKPTRDMVVSGLIREVLPKVDIYQEPVEVDIKEDNCVQTFATYHNSLVSTQLLFIYNVLNEIEAGYASIVLRNLSYIIRQCEQPLLVLLAEPSANKAWPRIRWLRDLLLKYFTIIMDERALEITFSEEPIKIALTGLNERLFSRAIEKNPPSFETSINRTIIACKMVPPEPFSAQHYEQLKKLQVKRDQKGKIIKETVTPEINYQPPLFNL